MAVKLPDPTSNTTKCSAGYGFYGATGSLGLELGFGNGFWGASIDLSGITDDLLGLTGLFNTGDGNWDVGITFAKGGRTHSVNVSYDNIGKNWSFSGATGVGVIVGIGAVAKAGFQIGASKSTNSSEWQLYGKASLAFSGAGKGNEIFGGFQTPKKEDIPQADSPFGCPPKSDPIVIDLDGVELTATYENGVYFDSHHAINRAAPIAKLLYYKDNSSYPLAA